MWAEISYHALMLAYETVFLIVGSIGWVFEATSLPGKDWYKRTTYGPIEGWLNTETNKHTCHII